MTRTLYIDESTLRQALHAMKRCAREGGMEEWKPWISRVELALAGKGPASTVPNSPIRAYQYFRKHIPSGDESRTSFSEFQYNQLGLKNGEGIPLKEAQALIESWNANLPETWHYSLD